MTHLFISYKREDVYQRNALIAKLNASNIPCWVDNDISAGEGWQETIDEALENAFAVAVILTPRSVGSPYVIYEWSWAMGYGIPVLPILFEAIPPHQMHARLSALQWFDCTGQIPDDLIQIIRQHQRLSPALQYAETYLNDVVMPIRFLIRIAAWLYEYSEAEYKYPANVAFGSAKLALDFAFVDLKNTRLREMWIQVMPSFPRAIRLKANQLTSRIESLIYGFYQSTQDGGPLDVLWLKQEWENSVEPLLSDMYGFNNPSLDELESRLSMIPSDPSLIWEEKTRLNFFTLANFQYFQGLPESIVTSIRNIFSQLFRLTSPEALQEYMDEYRAGDADNDPE